MRLYSQADAGAGSYTLKGVGVSGTVLIPDGVKQGIDLSETGLCWRLEMKKWVFIL
jgi:hypothetical protein